MWGGDLIFDGYVVAKFSPWREAPRPAWVYPGFDLEEGKWREGQVPPENLGPGCIDLSAIGELRK